MTPRPVNIAASRSRGMLLIDWDDSHHSAYPLAGLRAACPCAECRGGHENMGRPVSPDMLQRPLSPSQSRELESLEIVGSYALHKNESEIQGTNRWSCKKAPTKLTNCILNIHIGSQ
jgi:DUF971 family protein